MRLIVDVDDSNEPEIRRLIRNLELANGVWIQSFAGDGVPIEEIQIEREL